MSAVVFDARGFDEALAKAAERYELEQRDRAFARAIAAAVLRNRGALQDVVASFLEKPLPGNTGRLQAILLVAAAQLLILKTPPHAVISIAVDQTRADPRARRFDRLTNAVLRRVSERGAAVLERLDAIRLNVPAWMFERWQKAYGAEMASAIARASLEEAALDISVKSDAALWANKLSGELLSAGSVRLPAGGRVEDLPGFGEGAWWVQDAAAALPARLLADVRGLDVADLCAAPGGKTAQLAAAGARVVAVDHSATRLQRVRENLARLKLDAELITADVAEWTPNRSFDAVLVDAPCTATGTIRRHPDILHLKRETDVAALAATQTRILQAAARLVRPGGRLVYCTCSLEPEEGPVQVQKLLESHSEFQLVPITPDLIGGQSELLTESGALRTLPMHTPAGDRESRGMDGFYAALLVKSGG